MTLADLKRAVDNSEWAQKNVLFAVAGGEKDGTSGLRDDTASFSALRKEIERFANIIFSGNPKQASFWRGKEGVSIEELQQQQRAETLPAWLRRSHRKQGRSAGHQAYVLDKGRSRVRNVKAGMH
ncbi:hypothetical protein [Cupriavidus campinensis]|nr:hypothetical protein [Cupriavidus campinensis]